MLTPGARRVESLAHLVKRPSDSYLAVELPFGRDVALRDAYVSFRGQIRVGRLLEELDAFAGAIAYRHIDDGEPDTEMPTLVTASFDRLDLLTYPLLSDVDMQMRGMVTYVGASSLNIDLDFVTVPADGSPARPVMMASTTFVARNSRTGKAMPVPRLKPESSNEVRLFEAGKLASDARKAARGRGLDRIPPTGDELAMVHQLFQELSAKQGSGGLSLGPGCSLPGAGGVMLMEDTLLTSTELTMPQDRNVHGAWGGQRKEWLDLEKCGKELLAADILCPAFMNTPHLHSFPSPLCCRQGFWRLADAPRV